MNKAFLVGRLTQDPETRQTPNGVTVTTLRMAVSRRMNRDVADYFTIVTWRGLADNCAKYLVKGQRVSVEGEIQMRTYDAKDGTKRTVTEIHADNVEFLDKPGAGGASAAQQPRAATGGEPAKAFEMEKIWMDDGELPF